MFCSVFVKEILSMIQFSMLQSDFLLIDFFLMCLTTSSKKSYVKSGESIDLKAYFSEKKRFFLFYNERKEYLAQQSVFLEKKLFPKFQGKRFAFKKCDKVWLFDCNLLSDYSSLSYCMKSVQICSYFWSIFSCIRIQYGD